MHPHFLLRFQYFCYKSVQTTVANYIEANTMSANKIVIITVIGWACKCLLAVAQDKVCTASCSSLGMLQSAPGKSCNDIYQINKASRGASGNYWINTTTGVYRVYCDMELECGGHKGGWMRIVDLDTSRGDDCPSGWTNISTPVAACISPDDNAGCYSTNFTSLALPYSKVCGMTVGYQKGGGPDAFAAWRTTSTRSINGPYVDGVSITYGNPRKHLWSYAVGIGRQYHDHTFQANCPCSKYPGRLPPSFVHYNYYCESGIATDILPVDGVYTSNPLWDGRGCLSDHNCCSDPNQPWFYRLIPLATSEDIEARICHDENREHIPIQELKLYVQ